MTAKLVPQIDPAARRARFPAAHSGLDAAGSGSPAVLARKLLLSRFAKPLVFMAALLPFAWLLYAAISNQLGAKIGRASCRERVSIDV